MLNFMLKTKNLYKIILIAIVIQSCCECLEEGDPPKQFCSPREATITKFDPSLIQNVFPDQNGNDSIVYYPTDAYSIHGFEFPKSKSSSGNLPIDNNRYSSEEGRDKVSIAQTSLPKNVFSNFPLYLAVLSTLPANSDINGDFIVTDVDLTNPLDPVAYLRFKGWLDFVDEGILSESSQDFCDFYENTFDKDNNTLVKYGKDITTILGTNRSIKRNSNANIISLIDSRGNILIEDISNPTNRLTGGTYTYNEIELWSLLSASLSSNGINDIFNTQIMNKLQADAMAEEIIDIEVHIGDYFYYQSAKGINYLLQFQNIAERNINGIKRRVSFMFTEV